MYIPTIFFGGGETCTQIDVSGSYFPDGVTFGQISSSDDSYFWIKVPGDKEFVFNTYGSITNSAKLLLVGGGGYAFATQVNPLSPNDSNTGGGAAGDVLYQDVKLQPGINYYLKGGRRGFGTGSGQGTPSLFIENYVPNNSTNWRTTQALGGGSNDGINGGYNTYYSGGNGITGNLGGGGGGAGSSGDGIDAQKITNYSLAGCGGPPTFLSGAIATLVGNSGRVSAGGTADSYGGDGGAYGCTSYSTLYGDGASGGSGGNNEGDDGVAFLLIPINKCLLSPTGSIILNENEPFTVTSDANITGSFTSGSDSWSYHIFTSSGYFEISNGTPSDAKIMLVAPGAAGSNSSIVGGGGAGGVAIKRNISLYGTYYVQTGNPNSNAGGDDSFFYPLSQLIPDQYIGVEGGGRGATYAGGTEGDGQDGGSGGGGRVGKLTGDAITPCPPYGTGKYCHADEYYGYWGGAGYIKNERFYGGGGGGAGGQGGGSASDGIGGSGYILDNEFFPYNVLFSSPEIARGGKGLDSPTPARPTQPFSGDGGDEDGQGEKGFICITFKTN